jgi:hypothetical protein
MSEEIKWNICPNHWLRNFECKIRKAGKWQEEFDQYNKWIFVANQIGNKDSPTFADQRNFLSGLLECEFRNDKYIFKEGHSRNPQRFKTLNKFKKLLEETEERFQNENEQKVIEFYLNKTEEGENDEERNFD